MERYLPKMYQESIYSIDYSKLFKKGIKFLLYDLDNTVTPAHNYVPPKEAKALFVKLKKMGFEVMIFSNSPKIRLKKFTDFFEIEGVSSARKPLPGKLRKLLKEKGYDAQETAIIGDQIMTDVKVGNKVGITTILIKPISEKDFLITKFNRFLENRKMNKLSKKKLFYKDRYYE